MADTDYSDFSIEYDKIANSANFLSITRLTASQYKTNPYRKVGDFFRDISTEDLQVLSDVCENYASAVEDNGDYENVPHFEEVLLLGEMLAAGEGILDRSLDDVMQRTNQMVMYIAIESLNRKGLVNVYHDNFSFGEDAGDKMIVEKKKDVDYD